MAEHIKIYAVKPKVQYVGNGITTEYPYQFPIFDETNMEVYFDTTLLETGYVVNGAGETSGGTVVFDEAPAEGVKITLVRNIPIERITDFQEGGAFRPKNLNDEFDRQTAFLQQVEESLARSLKVGVTSSADPSIIVPLVEQLYDDLPNIDMVAQNIEDVKDVAQNIEEVLAVPELVEEAKQHAQDSQQYAQQSNGYAQNSQTSSVSSQQYAQQSQTSATQASTSLAECRDLVNGIRSVVNYVNLLEPRWSDHLINNQSWLRADTFSWQDGNVYKQVYEFLVSEYNAGRDGTSGVLTYRRTPTNLKICNATSTNETELERRYNAYESTWFYLLDTTNKRFKLPRTNWGFKGIRAGNTVPGYIQETLPNIKGSITVYTATSNNAADGCFTVENTTGNGESYQIQNGRPKFILDASRSSSVYKDGAHVVERSESMYLYFYVGQFSQTATEQTAGLNAELFNSKADVSTPSIQATYLKTIYVNGTSGYRIWSDGYCEQWGRCSASGSQTVSFVKKFKDANYHISFSYLGANNTTGNVMDNSIETINANSFVTRNLSRSGSIMWISCGMLASGQY